MHDGQPLGITTMRIGKRYSCRVDNVDPGGIIGRGAGSTPEEAEKVAIEKAIMSLDLSRARQALRASVDHLKKPPESQ